MEKQTDKEITEGNKLIAEFMECKKVPTSPEILTFYVPPFYYDREVETGIGMKSDCGCEYTPEEMLYHSSWDWLMPVVEKIESTNRVHCTEYYPYMVTMWKSGCKISDGNNGREISGGFSPESKIDAVWTAVVQFIEWYNSELKQ